MLVGLGGMLDETLPPGGRSFATNPTTTFRRVSCKRDGPAKLVAIFDPGDDDSVGTDIESPLDQPAIELGDPHQGDRITANGGTQMRDDVFPVKVAVFGIDHDPVEPKGDRHLRDGRRIESHPQTISWPVGGKCGSKRVDRVLIHAIGSSCATRGSLSR